MLIDYIRAAMTYAKYEILEDETFYSAIPNCPGVWANEETQDACRNELQSVLEDWKKSANQRSPTVAYN